MLHARCLRVDIADVDGGEVGTGSDGQEAGGGQGGPGTPVSPAIAPHQSLALLATGTEGVTGQDELTDQDQIGQSGQQQQHGCQCVTLSHLTGQVFLINISVSYQLGSECFHKSNILLPRQISAREKNQDFQLNHFYLN